MKIIKKVLLLAAAMNVSASLLALDLMSPSDVEKHVQSSVVVTQEDLMKEEKNLDAVVREVEALKSEALALEQALKLERERHEAVASPEMRSKIKELEEKKDSLKKQLEEAVAVRERLQDQLLGVVGSLQKILQDVNTQEQKKATSEVLVSPGGESSMTSEPISSHHEAVSPTPQEGVQRVVSKKDRNAKEKQEKKRRRRDKKASHSKKRSAKKAQKTKKSKKSKKNKKTKKGAKKKRKARQ